MESTNKLNMLKSFESSFDPTRVYEIHKIDGTVSIGRILDFNKAQPGELFDDPETGACWDSEEVPVNFFIQCDLNSVPEKINFRQIQNIKFHRNI